MVEDCKRKPTQPSLAELGLQLSFATRDFAENSRNKLSQGGWLAGWVGRLEKVDIKPSQPAGA